MATSLVTLCVDEMLSCKISEYIQRHWRGEPMFRYISGSDVEILNLVCETCSQGDKLIVLAEECLIPQIKEFLEQDSIKKDSKNNSFFIGVLCTGELCKYGVKLYGSPDNILSLAYSLVSLSQSQSGVVSMVCPSSRAASLVSGVNLATMTESLGQQVIVVCTDEYGISQGEDNKFLELICHGVMGKVRNILQYSKDYSGVKLLDAKNCAPELYELNRSESKQLVQGLVEEIDSVVLAVLGSGVTALNLEIMRNSRSILCIGQKDEIAPMIYRYFGEQATEVLSKVVEISLEEYSSCQSSGEWSRLWHRI